MNIGNYTKKENGDYVGSLVTIGAVFRDVTFEAIRSQGNSPDYIVTTDDGELGAAWNKTSEAGNPYLSVSLKGPFVKTVYCALVQSEKSPGNYALIWNEPKKDRT